MHSQEEQSRANTQLATRLENRPAFGSDTDQRDYISSIFWYDYRLDIFVSEALIFQHCTL